MYVKHGMLSLPAVKQVYLSVKLLYLSTALQLLLKYTLFALANGGSAVKTKPRINISHNNTHLEKRSTLRSVPGASALSSKLR